jgi:hypothetical protein
LLHRQVVSSLRSSGLAGFAASLIVRSNVAVSKSVPV